MKTPHTLQKSRETSVFYGHSCRGVIRGKKKDDVMVIT
jgi:hypothetical protein